MTTKYNKPFRNFARALGTLGFPIVSKFIGDEGNVAKVTSNGELKVAVSGEVNIGDVTLDGVTIKDKDGNEAKVTSDGSQLVQLMGSIVWETLFEGTQEIAPGATWESPVLITQGFNFVRFNLLFNHAIAPENVRVRLRETVAGGVFNSSINGLTRTIPTVGNLTVNGGAGSNRTLTIGDVAIYYDSCKLELRNDTANPITLRRIDSRRSV